MAVLSFLLMAILLHSEIHKVVSHKFSTDYDDDDYDNYDYNHHTHDHNNHKHEPSTSPPPPISDHRFFLQEIFTKYGHRGQMTFEGFEHLMESLGLGNIIISDHDVAAHKQHPEINIHNSHDHTKKMDHVDVTTPKGHDHNKIASNDALVTTGLKDESSNNYHRHDHQNSFQYPTTSDILDATKPYKHQSIAPTASSTKTYSSSSKSSLNDKLYHYQLREQKIPELLVNISTLVDQHKELDDRRSEIIIEQCLSPREILDAFGLNQTSSLNPVNFLHLCPAIIYELDQGHCLFRAHSHAPIRTIPVFDQWLFASLAVLIISLCGLLSVAVIPIMQKWFYHTLLQFLIGLAVGSLSGDALLHLMPHAMLGGEGSHDHSNPLSADEAEQTAVWRGFAALFGIFFFFVAERVLASYAINKKQKNGIVSESKIEDDDVDAKNSLVDPSKYEESVGEKLSQYRKNSYSLESSEKEMIKMFEVGRSRKLSCGSLHNLEISIQGAPPSLSLEPTGTVIYAPSPDNTEKLVSNGHSQKHDHSHSHGHGHSHEVPDSISAVAWMVIMGDGLHNFCDGLAIGAAFASGIEGGISTAVAVFCHELPHELGDFAMLLKTGMKVREALLYNGLSSVLCLIGMAIGVSLGNVHSATSWIFAATAGMFIYIALVDMLPELSLSENSNTPSIHYLAVQVLGICTGASVMLLIATYEPDLKNIIS